jgi:flavodoxin
MRRALVVYYSRTGFTRKIAKEIASILNCEIEEIEEYRGRSGGLGFVRSAVQTVLNLPAAIKPVKNDPATFDLIVIGTPVWVGNLSAPVRAFISRHRNSIKEVALFCTCGGSARETLAKMESLIGRSPLATLTLTDLDISSGGYEEKLKAYVGVLSETSAKHLKGVA